MPFSKSIPPATLFFQVCYFSSYAKTAAHRKSFPWLATVSWDCYCTSLSASLTENSDKPAWTKHNIMSEEQFSPCLTTPIVKFRFFLAYVSLSSENPVCLSAICSFSILLFLVEKVSPFPPRCFPCKRTMGVQRSVSLFLPFPPCLPLQASVPITRAPGRRLLSAI